MPYLDKGKKVQNVEAERRIAYPEARKKLLICTVYSVTKPHLLYYVSTLKAP